MRDQSTLAKYPSQLVGIVAEREQAAFLEPTIQVDALLETGEAVVRHDDQQIVVAEPLHRAAQQAIHFLIALLRRPRHVRWARGGCPPHGPRACIARTCAERDRSHRTRRPPCRDPPCRRRRKTSAPVLRGSGRFVRERRFRRECCSLSALVSSAKPKRGKRPEDLRQIRSIEKRMRQRQDRPIRIEIQRRRVELELGRRLQRDRIGRCRLPWAPARRETSREPRANVFRESRECVGRRSPAGRTFRRRQVVAAKGTVIGGESGRSGLAGPGNGDETRFPSRVAATRTSAAEWRRAGSWRGREVGETPLRAAKIGDGHSGQHDAAELFDRER